MAEVLVNITERVEGEFIVATELHRTTEVYRGTPFKIPRDGDLDG